jgi:hypothetical protein
MPFVALLIYGGSLMRVAFTAALMLALTPAMLDAQQQAAPQQPAAPAAPPAAPRADQAPAPTTTSSSRTFTTPTGMIINAVRPERVADFEKVVAYLQAALSSSTNPTVRAQGQGWRVLKASEAGPNGSVLYVFFLDPAVAGAEYGLGRIFAEAYQDQAKLQEIWKLYTDSLASGGSLLSLTPVQPPLPEPATQP